MEEIKVYRIPDYKENRDAIEIWRNDTPSIYEITKGNSDEDIRDMIHIIMFHSREDVVITVLPHPSTGRRDRAFFRDGPYLVSYLNTPEVHKRVFDYLIDNYFKQYGYIGEVIHQSDDAIIEAPSILSHIADNIIKFDYKEDENEY